MLFYMMAAESGYAAAQFNVAYLCEQHAVSPTCSQSAACAAAALSFVGDSFPCPVCPARTPGSGLCIPLHAALLQPDHPGSKP